MVSGVGFSPKVSSSVGTLVLLSGEEKTEFDVELMLLFPNKSRMCCVLDFCLNKKNFWGRMHQRWSNLDRGST